MGNKRHSLGVHITDEDVAYARRQDRYNCAIVRAIQRELPEATRVMADANTIRFTLTYGDEKTRYIFETPKNVVNNIIRPFDEGKQMEVTDFSLDHAIEAYTPPVKSAEERAEMRRKWQQEYRTPSRARARVQKPVDHTRHRFLIEPTEPTVTADEALDALREKLGGKK